MIIEKLKQIFSTFLAEINLFLSKKIRFFDDRSFYMNANLHFGNFLFSSERIEFNY